MNEEGMVPKAEGTNDTLNPISGGLRYIASDRVFPVLALVLPKILGMQ
jgi:hypothetical protein